MTQAASAAARHAAEARLREAHWEEYRAYYAEECKARGVQPRGPLRETKERKAARLRAELAELEAGGE